MRLRFAVILLAILGELHASMVVPSSKEEVLAESDLVVVGKVEGKDSYRQDFYITNDATGEELLHKGFILTDWKIQVLETLKGECHEPETNVTWIGGTVEGESQTWSIDFYLDVGDVALFFLNWDERNEKWIPRGGSARVFGVENYGGSNNLKTTGGMSVVLPPDEAETKRTGPILHAETLDDFEGRRRGCVQQY